MMTDETRPMQSLSYGRNLLSQPSSCRFIRLRSSVPAYCLTLHSTLSSYSSPRSGPVCDRREVTGEGRSTETGADKRKQTGRHGNRGWARLHVGFFVVTGPNRVSDSERP